MTENSKKLHIAVFPWLAFGHMIPYLELSKLIARKGHKISFISTPKNIDRLPKLPPNFAPFINFVKIPLPHVEKLPKNAEATIDLPYEQVKYLKIAQDGLKEPIAKFLEDSAPDFIIFDFASYWIPSIASKFNIPTGYFSIFIAAVLGFTGPEPGLNNDYEIRKTPEEYTVPPKWVPFETTVAFKLFEVLRIFEASMKGEEENVSDIIRYYKSVENCDFLLVRSCSEFEPEWLKVVGDIHRKLVFPVGQLPTTPYEDDSTKIDAWREIKLWLDEQEKGKVIYVAFGSEAKPSQNELTELSLGLELSGLPFFWVLRTKRGESDDELIQLPEGFKDRTKGRGIVCTSWVPQLKILSHHSVGGFLTHSGWSSVVEAIQFEKPLVLLTFLADQGINARLLEEKKMAYSIPRDDRDGSFTRDSVAESLNLVLIEKKGEIYRKKIKEAKNLFCDERRQNDYVESLLNYLQNYKKD
uniref:Anthocyanidine rhamnosyl-transferase n=1 Tax=Solanum tuberosum TaxID=4113 RepID=M1BBL0_SOLTU